MPGQYAVRLTAGSITQTQPLTVVEDPRILRDGITLADLQEQFNHNMAVRELVSDANKTVARLRAAQQKLKGATGAQAEKLAELNALADKLITSPIRYSEPKLLTHITYLYSMTNGADQKPGRDAIERLRVLRKELDDRKKELDKIHRAGDVDCENGVLGHWSLVFREKPTTDDQRRITRRFITLPLNQIGAITKVTAPI